MKTKNHIFLEEFNEAFATGDTAHILESVTDDITWKIAGEEPVYGKEEVERLLHNMKAQGERDVKVERLFIHGRDAAANGTVTVTGEEDTETVYEFCDVYTFHQYKGGKIRKLTSYMVEVNQEKMEG